MTTRFALKKASDGSEIDLRPMMIVGKLDSSDIVLHEGLPSRKHARLTIEAGQLLVEDLESRNGTFVNGFKIAVRTKLHGGDKIRFDSEEFAVIAPQREGADQVTVVRVMPVAKPAEFAPTMRIQSPEPAVRSPDPAPVAISAPAPAPAPPAPLAATAPPPPPAAAPAPAPAAVVASPAPAVPDPALAHPAAAPASAPASAPAAVASTPTPAPAAIASAPSPAPAAAAPASSAAPAPSAPAPAPAAPSPMRSPLTPRDDKTVFTVRAPRQRSADQGGGFENELVDVPTLSITAGMATRRFEMRPEKGAEQKWSVGSDANNEIVLTNPQVSGKHAEIVLEHGKWLITDKFSTNGTWVNDQSTMKRILVSGDHLRFGPEVEGVFLLPGLLSAPLAAVGAKRESLGKKGRLVLIAGGGFVLMALVIFVVWRLLH